MSGATSIFFIPSGFLLERFQFFEEVISPTFRQGFKVCRTA